MATREQDECGGSRKRLSTDTLILLFVLMLVFLCMLLLAVTFTKIGSLERTLTLMQLQASLRPPPLAAAAPARGVYYEPPYAPLAPPPRSELFNPYA